MVNHLAKAIFILYKTYFGKTRHLVNDKDIYFHLHLNELVESYQQLHQLIPASLDQWQAFLFTTVLENHPYWICLSRIFKISNSVVLNQVSFDPGEHSAMSRDICDCHEWRAGSYWSLVSRGQR